MNFAAWKWFTGCFIMLTKMIMNSARISLYSGVIYGLTRLQVALSPGAVL